MLVSISFSLDSGHRTEEVLISHLLFGLCVCGLWACGFSWILHTMKKLQKSNWKLRQTQRSSCIHNANVCVSICHSYIDYWMNTAVREWRVSYMHGISVLVFCKNITEDQCCKEMSKCAKPEPLYCYERHRIKATNKVFEELRANAKKAKEKKTKSEKKTHIRENYHHKWQRGKTWERILLLKFDIVKTKRWWKLQSCKIKILHIMSHICYCVAHWHASASLADWLAFYPWMFSCELCVCKIKRVDESERVKGRDG